jgi:hypothetical protein
MNALSRLDNKLRPIFVKQNRHLEEASNNTYMACERSGIAIDDFLDAIEDGTAFDLQSFINVDEANFFDYVDDKFKDVAKRLANITAGGNGGMASKGRGEFVIALMSNLAIKPSTNNKKGKKGNQPSVSQRAGDLIYPNGNHEEVKYNGGKINVSGARGRDIYKDFLNNLNGIKLKHKDFLPFRKEEGNRYSNLDLEKLNASYGGVVLGQNLVSVSNNKLKELFLNRAMKNVFQQVDSLLVIDSDGSYVRSKNAVDGENYYKNLPKGIGSINLELRAYQSNPVSIYLHTKHHKDYQ